jgi:cytochrome c oxidase assembly protein subunit 11
MPEPKPRRANIRVALACAGVFLAMVGAAFAAVPFYRAFCQATGFNGAVKRASFAPGAVSPKTVTVRFDTNVNGVPWRFEPVQASQTIHLGAPTLAFFRATNTSGKAVTARALFNVVPEAAGQYFSKLECFCFTDQTLAPGQTAEFPVVYYVDPRFAEDRDTRYEPDITLSYTFFRATDRPKPVAEATTARRPLGAAATGRL